MFSSDGQQLIILPALIREMVASQLQGTKKLSESSCFSTKSLQNKNVIEKGNIFVYLQFKIDLLFSPDGQQRIILTALIRTMVASQLQGNYKLSESSCF